MDLLVTVKNSICPHGVSAETLRGKTVLAAVSGGVDSMVMLDLLRKLSQEIGFTLRVITVNHNIRPDAETSGDAELVANTCASYGIPCTVRVLRRGLVAETSAARGKGTEEAARFLRYEVFEEEARKIGAGMVCVAHNRNDRLETILQRFLQGAGVLSSFGMRQHRGIYSRPLFDISRSEIEEYAARNNIQFRTDATNADNSYFRNRIRNSLIPFLNELEPGWDSAVLHGAEKNMAAADDINTSKKNASWTFVSFASGKKSGSGALCMDETDFDRCPFTARITLLYEGLTLLKCPKRIPYSMLASFADGAGKVSGAGVKLERKGEKVYLSIFDETFGEKGEAGFFVFVPCHGRYDIGGESLTIRAANTASGKKLFVAETDDGCVSGEFFLPVVIRSGTSSDSFKTSGGERKLLSKIFSEWHVMPENRWKIPVFEDDENRGVWGSLFGYPDWFVKIDS